MYYAVSTYTCTTRMQVLSNELPINQSPPSHTRARLQSCPAPVLRGNPMLAPRLPPHPWVCTCDKHVFIVAGPHNPAFRAERMYVCIHAYFVHASKDYFTPANTPLSYVNTTHASVRTGDEDTPPIVEDTPPIPVPSRYWYPLTPPRPLHAGAGRGTRPAECA